MVGYFYFFCCFVDGWLLFFCVGLSLYLGEWRVPYIRAVRRSFADMNGTSVVGR